MRNLVVLLFIFMFSLPNISAQEKKTNNIFLEIGGASNGIGVSYDTRVKKGSKFGYRVGLSFSFRQSSTNAIFMGFGEYPSYRETAISAPLGVNYLIGNKRHRLELGLGANLGIYNIHLKYSEYTTPAGYGDNFYLLTNTRSETKKVFGYFMFSNIGYRYQREKGFMFRTGISPSFSFGDSHGLKGLLFAPYMSFGYTF